MAWRTPVAPAEAHGQAAGSGGDDFLTGIVIGYIASVLTSTAIVLTFLKNGW